MLPFYTIGRSGDHTRGQTLTPSAPLAGPFFGANPISWVLIPRAAAALGCALGGGGLGHRQPRPPRRVSLGPGRVAEQRGPDGGNAGGRPAHGRRKRDYAPHAALLLPLTYQEVFPPGGGQAWSAPTPSCARLRRRRGEDISLTAPPPRPGAPAPPRGPARPHTDALLAASGRHPLVGQQHPSAALAAGTPARATFPGSATP